MLFQGTGTALITPFKNDAVDFDAYGRLIEAQLSGGVEALIVLGTTGEAATMTAAEKRDVIAFAVKTVHGRVPVIVGTGTNCTATTIENTKEAFELGALGALVVTPYYNKPTQAGLTAHFKAVCAAVTGPIIAYNVPGRTGCRLNNDTILALATSCPNLDGIKEATGDQYAADDLLRHVKVARPDFGVWSGNDDAAFHMTLSGGDGVISVVSNLAPKAMSDLIRAARKGDMTEARRLHMALLPLAHDLFIETNPCPVKAGAAALGLCDGSLRLPLVPCTERTRTLVEADLMELNLL